jgi:hypothetical protein
MLLSILSHADPEGARLPIFRLSAHKGAQSRSAITAHERARREKLIAFAINVAAWGVRVNMH